MIQNKPNNIKNTANKKKTTVQRWDDIAHFI